VFRTSLPRVPLLYISLPFFKHDLEWELKIPLQPQEELKRMGLSALLQNLIASFLSKYLLDEKIPEPLRHTYERLSFLSAVDSIR